MLSLIVLYILLLYSAECVQNEKMNDDFDISDILIEELKSNETSTEVKDKEIRDAIDVFRKYDLWKKAYDIQSQIDGNKSKWELIKSQHILIHENRNEKPDLIELSNDISIEMKETAKRELRNAIRKYDDFQSIASSVCAAFNKMYKKYWHCIVGSNAKQYNHKLYPESYMIIKYGEIVIQMFMTKVQTLSESDIIKHAQKSNIKIEKNGMNQLMTNQTINETLKAIKSNDNFDDISEKLQNIFDSTHGKYWNCIVHHGLISRKYMTSKNLFIELSIGDVSIIIFKNPILSKQDVFNSVKSLSKSAEPIIPRSEMNKQMQDEVIKIAREGLNHHKDFDDIANYIKSASEDQFGKYWNCIVGVKDQYVSESVAKHPGTFIYFGFANGDDEIMITLFKNKVVDSTDALQTSRVTKAKVIEGTLKPLLRNDAVEISTQGVNMYHDFGEIGKHISDSFDSKHASHWHCIVGLKSFFDIEDTHKSLADQSYVIIEFAEIRIIIVKAA